MKLLIIIPSILRGGVEEYALRIAREMVKRDWKIDVAFPKRKETNSLVNDFESVGIEYHPIEVSEKLYKRLLRIRRDLPNFIKTICLLRKIRPNCVFIIPANTLQCFGSILGCGLLKIPTLVRFGLVSRVYKNTNKLNSIYNWARRRNQQWITVSDNNRDLINKSFNIPKKEIKCIPNGTKIPDISFNDILSEKRMLKKRIFKKEGIEDCTLLLTVGRLEEQKGHKDLVEIIPNLVKECKNIKLIWVGVGNERRSLEEQLAKREITKYVEFMGYRNDVLEIMKACDYFVFPTYYEGSPSVIVEAMAHMLPIVTSDASGITEVIDNKQHGLVYKSGDIVGLRDSVLWALRNKDEMRCFAKNARERVERDFSIVKMVSTTMDTISNVTK